MEYPSIESLDADIKLLKEELRRLKQLRRLMTPRGVPISHLLSLVGPPRHAPIPPELEMFVKPKPAPIKRRAPMGEPKPKRTPHLGRRAADLPPMLSLEGFKAYLDEKRTLNPTNDFWQNEEEVRDWLQTKGVTVSDQP